MARARKEPLRAGRTQNPTTPKRIPPAALDPSKRGIKQASKKLAEQVVERKAEVERVQEVLTPEVTGRFAPPPGAPPDDAERMIMKGTVLLLKAKCANKDQIASAMRERFNLSRDQSVALEMEALHELALRCKENSMFARAEAVHRIAHVLTDLHSPAPVRRKVMGADGKYVVQLVPGKKNYQAIYHFETLLAKVQGTFEPTQINVNMTATSLTVFANLTDQRRAQYLKQAKERDRLARLAQAQLPELPSASQTA